MVYQGLSLPEAAATVDAWVEAAPESRFARLAAGIRHAAEAERARGTDFAANTPEASFDAMRAAAAKAKPHLLYVLETSARLSPACTWALRLGRITSDEELLQAGMVACREHAPSSFWFVREMFRLADPVWGGSPQAVADVASYARSREQENPLLATLAIEPEFRARDPYPGNADPASIDKYRRMARAVADPYVLAYAGEGLLSAGRTNGDSELAWEGIAVLTQAIRFAPPEYRPYFMRGVALGEFGQPAYAAADFARLIPDEPLDFNLQRLWQRATIAANGGEPFEPRYDDWAKERRICAETIAAAGEESEACSEALVQRHPDDPFAWWIRADAHAAASDRAGERMALGRFLEVADPANPASPVLVARARERLAALDD
jgi:hypothetical protein